MLVTDINLYMKFQRQPRVLGTVCFYAPTNKLLIPDGIKRGAEVFVIDYTQSKDDVYVTVADIKWWNTRTFGNPHDRTNASQTATTDRFKAYIKDIIPPGDRIMVIWKDLAQ